MNMLEIQNLHVAVDGKPILKGIDLSLDTGEVHAIMGPNGSGKSTLAHVLAGRDGYEVMAGTVHYQGRDLLAQRTEVGQVVGDVVADRHAGSAVGGRWCGSWGGDRGEGHVG